MAFLNQPQSTDDNTQSQNPQNDKPTFVIENMILNVVRTSEEPPIVRKEQTKNGVILHCEDLFLCKQIENLGQV